MMRTSLYICLNSFMILDVHSMLLLDTAMDCMIELKIYNTHICIYMHGSVPLTLRL